MENDATPTEEYGEMPHLTISYIKRNIEFFFMKHKFHFDDFNENHRERFLFKAIDNISDIIENSQPGQVIQFETPVELYAQGAWDRKRGTFDGYCNGLPPQKLYGETMYEFLIVGVEISSIG